MRPRWDGPARSLRALDTEELLHDLEEDEVGNFFIGQGDRLNLAGIEANTALPNNQAFRFIGEAGFTAAGQICAQQSGGDTLVYLNTDADLAAEGVIRLDGLHAVQASWFVL